MNKILLFILFFMISLSFANEVEDLTLNKIKYALNCNAKVTYVTEVKLLNSKLLSKKNRIYKIYGAYKSILSASVNFKGIGIGDEFHPISGSFVAIVQIKDNDVKLNNLMYKISFKKGRVKEECLK
jgi:hypothetical protein